MKQKLFLIIAGAFIITGTGPVKGQLNNPGNIPFHWRTDTTKRIVDLKELTVVLPRNAFPSIDYPKFVDKDEGLGFFYEHEPVIAVEINGVAKAYPLNMLTMHEMSNDSLGGVPILPTYCPLCNSSIVFDRRLSVDGTDYVLEFEVSGMLRNSDMVMADTQTHTWWQQLTGSGIVGTLAGVELNSIPSMILSVGDFFSAHPDGKILSPKTGTAAEERYGMNPYENYDDPSGKPYDRFFDHGRLDHRLPAMERILTVETMTGYRAYPFSMLKKNRVVHDEVMGRGMVIFYKPGMVSVLDDRDIRASRATGSVTAFYSRVNGTELYFKRKKTGFTDVQTGSFWDISGKCLSGAMEGEQLKPMRHSQHFAFAWLTFFPDTEIWGMNQEYKKYP